MNIAITGASRGIGKALAEELVRQGHTVFLGSRSPIRTSDARMKSHLLDVSDETSVIDFFHFVEQSVPFLDGLVNNAGIGCFKPIAGISLQEWQEVFSINLVGAFLCTREALKLMTPHKKGRIVNIGSIAEEMAFENSAPYAASKAALKMLSQCTNEEGKHSGVFCTHVTLGATATDIWKSRPQFDVKQMLSVEEVAKFLSNIFSLDPKTRLDSIKLLPPTGVL